ncbi:MAG: hypothetical protein CVT63_01075 [Candidatus Anoxymicrobium japonicum]|uniref:Histidine kinase/HSP90-like ATPase domain-containing protein n=1 Tax=Candidatus Anoxymicrobium japonicum TaxID=2013648 RepID=A0A2N3G7V5_9ACTN|nr:MAG: hypothetical protein CVT63_01075 [Candidatus Anoxymicrobium japonicum]
MNEGNARNGRSQKVSCYTLAPFVPALTTLREFMKATLISYPGVEPYIQDIITATHEAAKNAVVHNPGSSKPIDVICEIRDRAVLVEVSDRGHGFKPTGKSPCPPDIDALSGRGFFIMHSLMDEVQIKSNRHGSCVRMLKRL